MPTTIATVGVMSSIVVLECGKGKIGFNYFHLHTTTLAFDVEALSVFNN